MSAVSARVVDLNPAPSVLQAAASPEQGRDLGRLVANRIAIPPARPENRQSNLATCLRTALYRGAAVQECRDLFLKLDPETQLCCYELLLRDHIVDAGIASFLRNPASLVPHLSSLQPTPPQDLIQACQGDLQTAHDAFQLLSEDDQLRCYELLCREEIRQKGLDEFMRNPSALLRPIQANRLTYPIIDHLIRSETGLLPRRYEHYPFFPHEFMALLCAPATPLPRGVAAIVAEYVNDSFFGPEHWRTIWGGVPVKLLPEDYLRQKVEDTRKELPKPLQQMDAVDCANFLAQQGNENYMGLEYTPEIPEALYRCLNTPIRPGEPPAGLTCSVTFIPEFVRRDGKVIKVTTSSLKYEFGPNPKQGNTAKLEDDAYHWFSLEDRFRASCCYLVMERAAHPNTKGQKPSDLRTRICQLGDGGWALPYTRDCMAAFFSRCAWQGPFWCRSEAEPCAFAAKIEEYAGFLSFSGFDDKGRIKVTRNHDVADPATGAAASRKFLPSPT